MRCYTAERKATEWRKARSQIKEQSRYCNAMAWAEASHFVARLHQKRTDETRSGGMTEQMTKGLTREVFWGVVASTEQVGGTVV